MKLAFGPGKDIKAAGSGVDTQDHVTDVVSLSERRSPLLMGLLWITMVTGFPSVLAGFDWYKAGLTLSQIFQAQVVSVLLLLLYSIPAVYLGSKSGQTFALLSRSIFGRWGSYFVSFNLVWLSIAWYGLNASFLGESLKGLFPLPISSIIFSACVAILMTFNNLFGFTGIANFARYLAAPVLIAWVGVTFFKSMLGCPAAVIWEHGHTSISQSWMMVSSFTIGYAIWGNEPDYWRYAKPNKWGLTIPLVVAILLGQVIFPIAGWMTARLTGITEYAAATKLMVQYAFGGWSAFAALVLIITYVAMNDSELYGAINGMENIKELPRKLVVVLLGISCAITAACLSQYEHAFELIVSINSVILPSTTVIMLTEWFLISRIIHGSRSSYERVYGWDEVSTIEWPAIIALICGCLTGLITSGVIHGTESAQFGIFALNAWIASAVTYSIIRLAARIQLRKG